MAKLSNINGKFAVEDTGAIRFSDQTGTTGQILKSNGNSAPTWVDPNTVGTGPWLPLAGGIVSGATTFQSSLTVGGTLTANQVLINSGEKLSWGTQGVVSIEGSTGSNQMEFRTNSTDAMIIDSSGNVGVGTASLEGKLTIQYTSADPPTSGTTANSAIQILSNLSPPHQLNIGVVNAPSYGSYIQASDNNLAVNYSLLLQPNGGNVGIGTTSPASAFGFSKTLEIQGAANAEVNISQSNNSKDWSLGIVNGANYQQTTSGQDYIWIIGGSEKMRIDSSGNVGIKNTSPSDFLSWQQQLVVGNGSADAGITIYHGSGGGNQGAIVFADGNTGTNRYRGIISYNGADEMKFFTSTLERIKINDAGNVFISTPITNAFYGLSLTYNNTNTADFTVNQATGQIKIGGVAAGYYPTFYSAGSERMRILANGNIAFNATSNLNLSNFQISTGSGLGEKVDVFIANTSGTPYVNSGTTTQLSMGFLSGTANYVATGQILGNLQFFGQANDAGYGGASIKALVITGGNVNRSSHAVDMVFSTMAAGSVGNEERMRITSAGEILIGTGGNDPSSSQTGFSIQNNAGLCLVRQATSDTNANTCNQFINPNGVVGTIQTSGSSTSFNTSSDYRLKENVEKMTGALDRVSQLKPSRFNFIADANKTVDGFLAHEVQEIVPEAISGEKDAINEEGNAEYQGIDQSKLVPLLVGAIQELKAEIEILKNK